MKLMLDTDTMSAHLLGCLSYPNAACMFLYFQPFPTNDTETESCDPVLVQMLVLPLHPN